jgi:glycosyltransferase involved in cell wall biosynthesis
MSDQTNSHLSVLWVTPFTRTSAIGRFSRLVTDALAERGLRVSIAACEARPITTEVTHPTRLPLLIDADEIEQRLHEFDIVIYNIGNYYPFHGALPKLISKRSGLFIFHDLYLYDFFRDWLSSRGELREHDAIVKALYGPGVNIAVEKLLDPDAMLRHSAENYPMVEWLAPRALGSVSHSRFGVPILKGATGGPVAHIPLAYDSPDLSGIAPLRGQSAKKRISTFGAVNPNKRVEAVIRAVGSSRYLSDAIQYSVVGSVTETERSRLAALAASLGVELEITGHTEPEVYAEYLRNSDAVFCLRFPTTESASATAIESMLAGRPTIVTEIGFYRDLPDDLVFKVDPGREHEDVVRHLQHLVSDPDRCRAIGRKAEAWARKNFAPASYAAQIEAFIYEVLAAEPAVELGFAMADAAALLRLSPADPAVARWIKLAEELFSEAP